MLDQIFPDGPRSQARNVRIELYQPVVRVEQLYPIPVEELTAARLHYPALESVVWVQEEPENMGAYGFVHAQLHHRGVLPEGVRFGHVAREESGSPASGSATVHEREQGRLLERAFDLRA